MLGQLSWSPQCRGMKVRPLIRIAKSGRGYSAYSGGVWPVRYPGIRRYWRIPVQGISRSARLALALPAPPNVVRLPVLSASPGWSLRFRESHALRAPSGGEETWRDCRRHGEREFRHPDCVRDRAWTDAAGRPRACPGGGGVMPGMNTGIRLDDPTVVAAFRSALVHQGLIALLVFASLGMIWISARVSLRPPGPDAGLAGTVGPASPEPTWRQVLRVGFGLLWLLDGILQAQPQMALGLPSQVMEPTAASSPHWVQHLVNWAGTTWSYHPLQAAAASVWIQVGIGIWMLGSSRGVLSRLAGLASVGWGLVVWAFGESFGGIFAPGLTWLFGAPGAVLIYCVAGALIALPDRAWHSRRLGRLTLAGAGAFLVGMAVLQAWPGRGFWQGTVHGHPGTLAGMTAAMAPTPQPHVLSAWISAFTAFDETHGFAVNLFIVIALVVIGAAFLSGRPRLIRPALAIFAVLCLAAWMLVEDFGVFGGVGTDPNSMIPMVLIAVSGYLAVARAPAPTAATEQASAAPQPASWRDRLRIARAPRST